MRVTIQVQNGPSQGRRYALNAGQMLTFGRNDNADIAFPDDDQMSSRHFQLRVDRVACRLTDLGTTNGTRVNDESVERCVLRHDDVIGAGNTTFQIRLEGRESQDSADHRAVNGDSKSVAPAVPVPPNDRLTFGETFPMNSCSSGLIRVCGELDQVTPMDLAATIANVTPMYLLVDHHRFDAGEELDRAELLFDWIDPAAAEQVSPRFLPFDDKALALMESAWGADALVGIVSDSAPDDVLIALRELIKPSSEKDGTLGICWPEILSHVLTSQSCLSQRLTGVAAAYLMEDPIDPQRWQLFGSEALADLVDQIGLPARRHDHATAEAVG